MVNLSLEPDLQLELDGQLEENGANEATTNRIKCSCRGKCMRKCPCLKDFVKCDKIEKIDQKLHRGSQCRHSKFLNSDLDKLATRDLPFFGTTR